MANGIPLSIAQLPPLSSALSNSIIPVTQNGTTGSMTLAILLGGPYTATGSLAGTETLLVNQGGTLKSSQIAQLITQAPASAALTGTEVLANFGVSYQKTTLAQLITQATASSAIAGTESFINFGAAYQKTTIAQLLTQATAAGNALPADLIPTTQGGLWRATSVTQLTAGSILYTAGGTANAQTITPSPVFGSLRTGMVFSFLPVAKNTGAATFSVNGIAANIFAYGAALLGGELPTLAVVQYDGTQFNLLNPDDSFGTTAIALTGMASGGTGNLNWRIVKNHVIYLFSSAGITGTSNAVTMTVVLPAFLTAGGISQNCNACSLTDNSSTVGNGLFSIGGTTVTFGKTAPGAAGFTASATKGLSAGFTVNYVNA